MMRMSRRGTGECSVEGAAHRPAGMQLPQSQRPAWETRAPSVDAWVVKTMGSGTIFEARARSSGSSAIRLNHKKTFRTNEEIRRVRAAHPRRSRECETKFGIQVDTLTLAPYKHIPRRQRPPRNEAEGGPDGVQVPLGIGL